MRMPAWAAAGGERLALAAPGQRQSPTVMTSSIDVRVTGRSAAKDAACKGRPQCVCQNVRCVRICLLGGAACWVGRCPRRHAVSRAAGQPGAAPLRVGGATTAGCGTQPSRRLRCVSAKPASAAARQVGTGQARRGRLGSRGTAARSGTAAGRARRFGACGPCRLPRFSLPVTPRLHGNRGAPQSAERRRRGRQLQVNQ